MLSCVLSSTTGFFASADPEPGLLTCLSVPLLSFATGTIFLSFVGASFFCRKLPSQTAVCTSRKINRNMKNFIFWIFDRVIVPCHLNDGDDNGDDDGDTFLALPFCLLTAQQFDVSTHSSCILHVARRPARTNNASFPLPRDSPAVSHDNLRTVPSFRVVPRAYSVARMHIAVFCKNTATSSDLWHYHVCRCNIANDNTI